MSDKFAGGIKAGSVNVSLPLILRSTTDNTALTGKVFGDVTATYWRQGGTPTAITPATLASITAVHADGGFLEADAVKLPGAYRFDAPDAAFAVGVEWVLIGIVVAGAYVFLERYALTTNVVQSGDSFARLGAPAGASTAADILALKNETTLIVGDTNELQTDWVNGGRLDLLLDAIPTTAMRGTDNAALASVCTSARLSELDAATGGKMANVVDALDTLTKAAGAGDLTAILVDTKTSIPALIAALNDLSAAQVNAEVDNALDTAIPVTPAANSINERIKTLDDNYTAARAPNLDNLDAAITTRQPSGNVTVGTNNDKTGYRLSAAGVDNILDETYEGTTTFRQFLRLAASSLFGKLSGAGTTTVNIRDEANTKNRIAATVDSNGNRSAVTLDKTA